MATIKDTETPIRYFADGGIEVWVLRDGIQGSVVLPPGTWTAETVDDDIDLRIEADND